MKNVRKLGWTGVVLAVIMFTLGFCTAKLTNIDTPAHGAVLAKRESTNNDLLQRKLDDHTESIAHLTTEVSAMRQEFGKIALLLVRLDARLAEPKR